MIAHYLRADHRECFRLGRVDLAGHDRRSRLVGRQADFADPRARAGGKQADVIGDFHERDGDDVQRAGCFDDCIMRGHGLEFVGSDGEFPTGQLAQLRGKTPVETAGRIQARPDGGSALGKAEQAGKRCFDAGDAVLHLGDIGREFLAQGQRRRILQMRPPRFHDSVKGFFPVSKGRQQFFQAG